MKEIYLEMMHDGENIPREIYLRKGNTRFKYILSDSEKLPYIEMKIK